MKNSLKVLFTIAEELAELARSSVPAMRKGEKIQREWLDDGVYYRETFFNGETFLAGFDFRQRRVL